MGQGQSGLPRQSREDAQKKKDDAAKKKKKFEPRGGAMTRKRRKKKGPSVAVKIPTVYPTAKCKLRLLKLERIKDYLLMEEEFIRNQEVLKPKQEKDEEERSKVDDLRGTPMGVGTLEEMIDDNHAIVSSSSDRSIMSASCRSSTKICLRRAARCCFTTRSCPSSAFSRTTPIRWSP
ncbi:hypothetical protein PINS_up007298 [Pythium insidiosum]|nr:hypothetical protein PINS_up007298 [Pythium insidiosum]